MDAVLRARRAVEMEKMNKVNAEADLPKGE
jgi:hypothetical protein